MLDITSIRRGWRLTGSRGMGTQRRRATSARLLGVLLFAVVLSTVHAPEARALDCPMCVEFCPWYGDECAFSDLDLCKGQPCCPPPEPGPGPGGGGGGAGPGPGPGFDAGAGVYVNVATGNVWTSVPVVQVSAGALTTMNFYLRYDSRYAVNDGVASPFRFRDMMLGPGWTHSYNSHAFKDEDWTTTVELTVISPEGRRVSYRSLSSGSDPGGAIDGGEPSYITTNGDDYQVNYPSGRYLVYTEVPTPCPSYLTDADSTVVWYRLTRIRNPQGLETVLTYDDDNPDDDLKGLLEEIEDPHGRKITLEYYGYGKLESITDPAGETTTLSYSWGMLSEIEDPLGHAREYEYDNDNRVTSETLRNGVVYVVEYEKALQSPHHRTIIIRDTDANGAVVTWVETAGDTVAWSNAWVTSGGGAPLWGIVGGEVTVTDGENNAWEYEVDERGRVLSITPPEDDEVNRTIEYTYDDDNTNGFAAGSHELEGNETYKVRSRKVGDFDSTYYQYGSATAMISAIVDPEDNRTNYTRNSKGFVTKRQVEGMLEYWSYGYWLPKGDLKNEQRYDSSGVQGTISHAYTYYADGKRLQKRVTTDLHGNDTTWNYSSNGTLASVVADEDDLEVTTSYTHDAMGRVRTDTQERGTAPDVETEYFYDDAGRLTRTMVNSNGLALETVYGYDGEGNVTSVTDPRGVVTEYEYDERSRLTRELVNSNGLALETEYEYDDNDNLTKITDPKDNDTVITYYDFALAEVITDAENYDTKLRWDALGNLVQLEREWTAGGDEFAVTTLTYDGLSRPTSVVVDSNGLALETTYEYDDGGSGCGCSGTPGAALVSQITDPAGKRTYHQYDVFDRVKRIIREVGGATGQGGEPDADDVVTTVDWGEAPEDPDDPYVPSNQVEIINPEGESVQYAFDAAGRLSTRNIDSNGVALITSYGYDGTGPVRTITPPNGNTVTHTSDAAGRRTAVSDTIGDIADFTYNANGAVLTVTDGEDNVTSNGYDQAGRVTSIKDPNGETETYAYDDNGNLTLLTDREGRQAKYEYDNLDRVTKVTEDDGTGGLKRITEYEYDGLDNVLTLTAHAATNGTGAEQITTYKYDTAGRLTKVIYPDNVAVSSNGIARFTWNDAGTVATRTDQKGVVTTYTYNDLHRLTQRSYNDGVTPADVFEYDKAGRLTVGSNGVAEARFTYDDAGRLTDADQIIGETTYATDFQFEIDDQAHTLTKSLTYPGASTDLDEDYDGRGRLDSIVYGSRNLLGSSTYDGADRMTARSLGNGVNSTYTYNANSWLTQIKHVKDTLDLEKLSYGYDKVGNVAYRQVRTPGRGHLGEIYAYDTLHRLTQYDRGVLNAGKTAVTEAAPRPFVQTRAWTNLDMLGNWKTTNTTVDGDSPEADTRTVNAANEYLTQQVGAAQSIDLVSDDNGNLTSNGTQVFAYDAENRLVRVTRKSDSTVLQEYAYDALGRRVRTIDLPSGQDEKKTTHVYAGSAACITEYDSTAEEGATRERWFVHGPGFPDPLVMVDLTAMGDVAAGTEEYLYYLKDLLGSVTALANSNGTVVERYVYDPYGKTTIETAGFYHDADLDGDVDEADDAHFDACFGSSSVQCVFVHDRDGNGRVDIDDYSGYFLDCLTTNGVAPGPNCARWSATYFDADGDEDVDLYDFGGFQECLGATDDVCLFVYDQDGDADVDLDDYAEFNAHVGTSGVPHPVVAGGSRYGNPFLWTGQRYDGSVGLYHFLYRSYSPDLGRWLQRDPLGYVDGASLFEYVASDPTGWIDPWGEFGRSSGGNPRTIEPIQLHPNVPNDPGALARHRERQRRAQESIEQMEAAGKAVIGVARGGVDVGTSVIPVVSDIRDVVEVATGKDAVTGEKLSPAARVGTVVAAVVPLVPAKVVRGILDAIKGIGKGGKKAVKGVRGSPAVAPGRSTGKGPSGKPVVHTKRHPTRKKAKDAARNKGKGPPICHPTPSKGDKHFHPTDREGKKIPGSPHEEY